MIYLIAIICPPLALLLKGKIFQAILNGVLWLISLVLFVVSFGVLSLLWIVTVIWAIISVKSANDQDRHDEIVDAIKSRD